MSDSTETPGHRLRAIRGEMSQQDFAEEMGVSLSTLRRYESDDRKPDADFLVALHAHRGVDPLALLLGKQPNGLKRLAAETGAIHRSAPHPGSELIEVSGGGRNFVIDTHDYCWVPFYDIEVSGGGGAEVLDEAPRTWNAWRLDYLLKRGLDPALLAEFSVTGYSMAPELNDGDTVLVDRRIRKIGEEDIYVIRMDNALVVKYAHAEPDGSIVIRSVNPDFPVRVVKPADYPDWRFEVIGRVARQGRDR